RRSPFFADRKVLSGPGIRAIHDGDAVRITTVRQSDDRRFLLQHPLDEIRGNMPFNDITIDHSGMAGMQPARHSVLAFNIRELLSESILLLDLETVRSQVTHPLRAAASRRVRIHRYRWTARK